MTEVPDALRGPKACHLFSLGSLVAVCGNDEGPFSFYIENVTCDACRNAGRDAASDALLPQGRGEASVGLLKSLETGLLAIKMFGGHGQHLDTCNGGEDGPCDCGYVDPGNVVESLLAQVGEARAADPLPSAAGAPSDD